MTTDMELTHTLPGPRLKRVTEFIELHLDQDLKLAQLGAVACMSPFHFARLFKRSTGLLPRRFVVRADRSRARTAGHAAAPDPVDRGGGGIPDREPLHRSLPSRDRHHTARIPGRVPARSNRRPG